jgi:hypothetical protein
MTDVWSRAWWCKYCANCEKGKCLKDVPYYCSSLECKYFEEPTGVKAVRKHSLNWYKKHVLVETV